MRPNQNDKPMDATLGTVEFHSADKIVESIARATDHTDRELLEASLMHALWDMLDVRCVALFRIINEYGEPACLRVSEVVHGRVKFLDALDPENQIKPSEVDGLVTVLETKKSTYGENAATHFAILPVTNHQDEVVSAFLIEGPELQATSIKAFVTAFVQIYQNYVRLLDDSEHDTLTGLLNRRTFDRDLERLLLEWRNSDDSATPHDSGKPRRRRSNGGNWLAVVDIDFFKQVNDEYGHLFGDEILLLMANIMRWAFRSYDKLFRFGGEEFVVILRSTEYEGALAALERFRNSVQHHRFPQIDQITVSIGFTEISSQTLPSEVVGHADEAMYYAKAHGRNRVCFHQDLVDAGAIKTTAPTKGGDATLF